MLIHRRRSIPVEKRKKYIEATKCLQTKPPIYKTEFPIVQSRYDDFVAVHVNVSASAGHDHKNLLIWHRYFITLFEDALINECGWDEGLPYWNWYLDIPDGGGNFPKSPVWDADTGFGGNGVVTAVSGDGPFKDLQLRIGPFGAMGANNPVRCLTRTISDAFVGQSGGKAKLQKWLQSTTYQGFMNHVQKDFAHMDAASMRGQDPKTSADIHFIGHMSIGGEMGDPLNSVNEPIFWLHHGAIDYYWSIWQEEDRKTRIYDLDASPKGGANQKALAEKVEMGVYGADLSAKQMADSENRDGTGKLCFKYEGPPASSYTS
ncbi:Di-copper centre-containing protein [Tothia fuscella]|uniref:Di-copper centre-containing protein n=1 Tax=Tothia fuscella TaxID=1048955 RepID=A0A9P4NY90_9PEZI|nr:Di-copper centre-containing protein [Tothia fuscella]